MNEQEFNKLQDRLLNWKIKNFGEGKYSEQLLGVIEEVGELAHAILKDMQGIRTNEDLEYNKKDAIGDIFVFLSNYINEKYKEKLPYSHEIAVSDTPDSEFLFDIQIPLSRVTIYRNIDISNFYDGEAYDKIKGNIQLIINNLATISNDNGWKLMDVLEEVAEEVLKRDWNKNKETGK